MATVEELSQLPRLGALYRSAVLGALRRNRPAVVPAVKLVLRDVGVDRDHLGEYQRVCGFRRCDALPASYPHVLAFPLAMALMNRPDFPFPLIGLVHVANRIDVLRPLDASARLTLRVRAEGLRPHERGQQIDLVASATLDDDVVWRGRSVYLRRSRTESTRRSATGSAARAGPPPASALWRVDRRVVNEYAEVSGDHNPIHTSRLLARALGFPRPIAHGMWTHARCLAALDGRLPDLYTVDVEFKRPILLPARVGFQAVRRVSGWTFAVHDARSSKPHLTGSVEAGAPC